VEAGLTIRENWNPKGRNMSENHSSAVKPLCTKADRDNIEAAIKTLFEPGQVVELRAPKAGKYGTISGYFNDHSKLAVELEELSGEVGAVYYTLNSVNPAQLARANNRIRTYASELTNDAPDNILRRAWLLVDCDPVRPAGVSATAEEKRAAKQMGGLRQNSIESGPPSCGSNSGHR
jgi:hypothetical protein